MHTKRSGDCVMRVGRSAGHAAPWKLGLAASAPSATAISSRPDQRQVFASTEPDAVLEPYRQRPQLG